MSFTHWLLWGFFATLAFTMLLAFSQGLKLTRMNLPFVLGSCFTSSRDKAKTIGFFVHLLLGLVFALLYVAVFHAWGSGLVRGALLGVAHACVVLTVVLPMLPGFHPRMASEQAGPTARRQLEPPGFLALHYGKRTPLAVLLTHAIYGAILGIFYKP
jgi:hypothetical protein